jgi:hypothetical protein
VYGGANLEASQVYARRALDFALPATTPLGQRFRAMLNKSGEGDSLLFVAAFAPLGKAMSEDTGHAHGNQSRVSQATRRSPADVLFGDAQGVVKP